MRKQTLEHIARRIASCKSHPRKTRDLGERLLSKIEIDEIGCWVWKGARFKKKYGDYAQIRMGGRLDSKNKRAHVVSYEHFVGKVPEGMELDHICQNTLCINPAHLEPVAHKENCKRRKDSGLPFCRHGHKYTPETTYIRPDNGRRECKVCKDISRIKIPIN